MAACAALSRGAGAGAGKLGVHSSFADPKRRLALGDYLCLFLLGLFNPVARTMRGLQQASHLPRVQAAVCGRPVSLVVHVRKADG